MSIPFIQYMRPDGRPVQVTTESSDEVTALADELIDAGSRFECEVLTTGHVSFTIERDDAEGEVELLAIEVVPNDADIPEAVGRLVRTAARKVVLS